MMASVTPTSALPLRGSGTRPALRGAVWPGRLAVGALALLSAAVPCGAQTLVADRPQAATTPNVVELGYYQVETGLRIGKQTDTSPSVERMALFGSHVRIGVLDGIEFRLGWDGLVQEQYSSRYASLGSGDADLGVKLELRRPELGPPALALLGTLVVPLGASAYTRDAWDPGVILSGAMPLEDGTVVTANLGVEAVTEPRTTGAGAESRDSTGSVWTYALNGRQDLWPGLLSGYAEISGAMGGVNDRQAHSLGAGIGYSWSPQLVLDGHLRVGLSRDAEDWAVGVGLSYRLPH